MKSILLLFAGLLTGSFLTHSFNKPVLKLQDSIIQEQRGLLRDASLELSYRSDCAQLANETHEYIERLRGM